MNTALVLFAVVVVAGLVECKPSLRDRIASFKARQGGGKGAGKGEGKGDDKKPDGGPDGGHQWPFAWMEYASLIGKCENARLVFEMIDYTPEEGVLVEACPHVMESAIQLAGASEEDIEDATACMRKVFPLLQCVNLQAEREGVAFMSMVNEEEVNHFEDGASMLFTICEEVFKSVAEEEKKLDEGVDAIEGSLDEGARATVANALRQLIDYASRR